MTSTLFDAETTVKTSTQQLTLGQELKENLGVGGLEENVHKRVQDGFISVIWVVVQSLSHVQLCDPMN